MNEIYCPSKIKKIYLIFMSMQNKQHKFSEHIPSYLKKNLIYGSCLLLLKTSSETKKYSNGMRIALPFLLL